MKKLTNISQTFDEDTNNCLSETKLISHLQNDNIEQHTRQSNIENHLLNKSIFFYFLSPSDAIELNINSVFKKNKFQILSKYTSQGTQTKLNAIFLPQSPLSKMKRGKIETQTLLNITRICQVNTLSYLIKTNQIKIKMKIYHLKENNLNTTKLFFYNKPQINNDLLSKENVSNIKSSIETKYQILNDHKHDEQEINVPIIQFEGDQLQENFQHTRTKLMLTKKRILPTKKNQENLITKFSSLKCINNCDMVDSDDLNVPMTYFVDNSDITSKQISF